MKITFRQMLISIFILVLLAGNCKAAILNVPNEYETIQAGIDAANHGDTVLVQRGYYPENINFEGKNIIVGGTFIITGNEDSIAETIINGDGQGSVVTFNNEETSEAALIGLTIQNGEREEGGGGGINIDGSNPILKWLIVRGNHSYGDGGGIYINDSQSDILNCTVINNSAEGMGGGLRVVDCSYMIISNCTITENTSRSVGGGIRGDDCYELIIRDCLINWNIAGAYAGGIRISGSSNTIQRSIIADNQAEHSTGGLSFISSGSIINCVVINNMNNGEGQGLSLSGDSFVLNSILGSDDIYFIGGQGEINYCNLQTEYDGGEGNIDADPQFVDPENGDYHIVEDSPCIDAGDPESDVDSDGSRTDIGVFPYSHGTLVIEGTVLGYSIGEPLENVLISDSFGDTTYSDALGFWRLFPGRLDQFDLTASIVGHNDSTIINLELELDDTLNVIFQLLHPEITTIAENIEYELQIGESVETVITIENNGDGVLEWSTKARLRGEMGVDPGTLRRSYPVGADIDDNGLRGVIYANERYYISSEYYGHPVIHILNQDGEFVDRFNQPIIEWHGYGFGDLAWDGELIWGSVIDRVYGINLEGEIIIRFEIPEEVRSNHAITYDPSNDWLWISSRSSNIYACNLEGEIQLEIPNVGIINYGLAYWQDDPHGYTIYLISGNLNYREYHIYKLNPETAESQFVTNLSGVTGGIADVFISSHLDDYSIIISSISRANQEHGGNRLDVRQLYSNSDWMAIDPLNGITIPEGENDLFLNIDATELLPMHYPAEMVIIHNAVGGETIIPVDLTVIYPNAVIEDIESIPDEFSITAAYPNPFNSSVKLNYSVPPSSQVSINLYDITGSLVDQVANGVHQSGQHSATWDASTMPSGIYFARMEAGGYSQTMKLMLMK